MSGVVADLELQVDPALDAVSSLGDAMSAVIDAFSSDLTDALALLSAGTAIDVPVEADTTLAEDALTSFVATAESSTPQIEVEADTTTAETDVDTLISTIESIPPGNIEVDANVDPAQSALDELLAALSDLTDAINAMPAIEADATSLDEAAASAENLGGSLEQTSSGASNAKGGVDTLSGAAAGLGIAMKGAQGQASGVAQGLLGISGASAGTAGAVLGVGAAFGTFFALGEKSIAATERMTLVFGEFAGAAESIDVGGLTGQLSDLAVQSGNSAAQMRQSSATIGRTAQDMGMGKKAAAELATQFQAIALRATAMNPNLGEAGAVMTRLQRALAMGGRAATAMGLGFLQAGQIAAHASIMFGKPKDQLSQFEKAAAGADIVLKKFGNTLGTDFNKGIQQTQVQFKALKAELVATMASIGRELVPAVLALAQAFKPLAVMVAETLGVAFKALVPIIQAVSAVLNGFVDGLSIIGDAIPSEVLIAFGVALGLVTVGLVLTSAAFWEAAVAAQAFLVALLHNPIFLAAAAIVAVVSAIGILGSSARSAKEEINDLVGELKGMQPAAAAAKFVREEVDDFHLSLQTLKGVSENLSPRMAENIRLFRETGQATEETRAAIERFKDMSQDAFKDLLKDVRDLAEASPGTAQKVVEGLRHTEVGAMLTEKQWARLNGEVAKGTKEYQKNTVEGKKVAAVDKEIADAAKSAGDKVAESLQTMIGASATLPTLAQEASSFLQQWTNAFGQVPVSGQAFKNFIQDTATQTKTWFDQIVTFGQQGMAGLALVLAGVGPAAAPQFAAGFAQLTEVERVELNRMLLEAELQKAAIAAVMSTYGPKLIAAFKKGGFAGLNAEMKAILNEVPPTISSSIPPAADAAALLGITTANATVDQMNTMPLGVLKAMTAGATVMRDAGGNWSVVGAGVGITTANATVDQMNSMPLKILKAMEAGKTVIQDSGGKWHVAGFNAGDSATGGLDEGTKGMAEKVGRNITAAVAEGSRHTGKMAEAGRALANGMASGLTQGALGVAAAGSSLAGAAATGALGNSGPLRAAGTALAAAFAAAIVAGGPGAANAGRNLVNSAAAGTRNTGLFAEAGKAAANGYANGLHAVGPAVAAAQALVAHAAGATRNTGAFAAAGAAAAGGYANGIRSNASVAAAAVNSMVAAACAKARNAHCSPQTIYETMFSLGNTIAGNYASGIRAETAQVVAATQDMAHAAVHSIDGVAVNPTVGRLSPGVLGSSAELRTIEGRMANGQPVTITVNGGGDPVRAAQEVARELAFQQRLAGVR